MAGLTLQDILDTGLSLEDILFNKDPVQVDVTLDTDGLANQVKALGDQSINSLTELKQVLLENNQQNRELLIKALSLVMKNSKMHAKPDGKPHKEITGLKVIRDGNKLMTDIEFKRG
jgi:hypothetical protein